MFYNAPSQRQIQFKVIVKVLFKNATTILNVLRAHESGRQD